MPLTLGWWDIGERLLLTVAAGALLGWNRGEHGHPAGMRTTLLVCLAASIAMIQVNLLLDARGKAGDSFVVLDLMRLPLGILSGMGFIGGGAILRRGSVVEGVTTAATLWFVTVLGLCFGGGQLGVGLVGTAAGFVVLGPLKWLEESLPTERRATVELTFEGEATFEGGPALDDILVTGLVEHGYAVIERAATHNRGRHHRVYELRWRAAAREAGPAGLLERFAAREGIVALSWRLNS